MSLEKSDETEPEIKKNNFSDKWNLASKFNDNKLEDHCLKNVPMYAVTKLEKLEGMKADGILGLSPSMLEGQPSIFGENTSEVKFLNKLHD